MHLLRDLLISLRHRICEINSEKTKTLHRTTLRSDDIKSDVYATTETTEDLC